MNAFRNKIVAVLALLLLVFFWIWNAELLSVKKLEQGPAPSKQGSEFEEGAFGDRSTGLAAESRQELAEESIRVRFVDKLSGKQLPLGSVALERSAQDRVEIEQGERIEKSWLVEPGAFWSYSIQVDEDRLDMRVAVQESLREEAEGVIHLPYATGIKGGLLDGFQYQPVEKALISARVFSQAKLDRLHQKYESHPFAPPIRGNLFYMEEAYKESFPTGPLVKEVFSQPDGTFQLEVFAASSFYVHAWHEVKGDAVGKLQAAPGEWQTWSPVLKGFITLSGVVKDSEGNPVENTKVKIGAVFSAHNMEFSPFHMYKRGMATGFATHDNSAAINLRTSVKTDSEGRYRVVVPNTSRYSASAVVGKEYGFETIEFPLPSAEGEVVLNVQTKAARGENVPSFLLRKEDGSPVVGAEVSTAIASDYLWQRQFPKVRSNSKGRVHMPWLEPGVLFGIFVKRDDLKKVFYSPFRVGETEVVMPNDYFPSE
ncbi:MAG: hypothetical protein DWQ01_09510 [Planctomycetota bacterium]|nr:MAG: hypothetical protein DWQ01_09510 [Planctomycetota bacterium]